MHYYLLVIAVPLWVMALFLSYRQIAFLLKSRRASGQLSDWKQKAHHWYPIVTFTAQDGNTYTATGNAGYDVKPGYKIGSPFPIRYDPANPKVSQVSSILHYWAAPVGFLILASAATFAFLENARVL
jgi:hypothetical protein